uniref:(northern house mosquito) hypothetical protein n=1 Tax=Culex pipiens TaxID=7175 RepID=A0A8D8CM28_CULPI
MRSSHTITTAIVLVSSDRTQHKNTIKVDQQNLVTFSSRSSGTTPISSLSVHATSVGGTGQLCDDDDESRVVAKLLLWLHTIVWSVHAIVRSLTLLFSSTVTGRDRAYTNERLL